MAAQPREFLPRLSAVRGAEQGRVFDSRIHGIGVGERRLEVPNALELPGVGCAVVPLVCAGYTVVGELVIDGRPGEAAVVRPLHGLTEPSAGLRGINTVRIRGRPLQVIHFPSGKMGAADLPILALPVGCEYKS